MGVRFAAASWAPICGMMTLIWYSARLHQKRKHERSVENKMRIGRGVTIHGPGSALSWSELSNLGAVIGPEFKWSCALHICRRENQGESSRTAAPSRLGYCHGSGVDENGGGGVLGLSVLLTVKPPIREAARNAGITICALANGVSMLRARKTAVIRSLPLGAAI
ncbi:hypothetical protein BU15DRAFT_58687 [Melanogaster broomeanus]|nr:hypothetical protein BU15DRAFT_58687 [Melanogaster broomeanus]